jgi:hypothetical protein
MSTITIVSMALMGILLFLLGANVTRQRAMRGGGNQAPTDPTDRLLIAIRVGSSTYWPWRPSSYAPRTPSACSRRSPSPITAHSAT